MAISTVSILLSCHFNSPLHFTPLPRAFRPHEQYITRCFLPTSPRYTAPHPLATASEPLARRCHTIHHNTNTRGRTAKLHIGSSQQEDGIPAILEVVSLGDVIEVVAKLMGS